jgi:hypothetical protein
VYRLAALAAAAVLALPPIASGRRDPPVDAGAIVRRSVDANRRDWDAAPRFDYMERDRTGGKTTFYRVVMLEGSPYLLRVNNPDRPSSAERSREEQEIANVSARRRAETPSQRARRIREYKTERERDHVMLEQLGDGFDFKLAGRDQKDGRSVYVIDATPRPGYSPPNAHARALLGMEGTLWIDTETFNWVHVTARVTHPVSIYGFLATVEPGTAFELEKSPVGDGIWLPSHFDEHADARVLFVFHHSTDEDIRYWGYKRSTGAAAP